MENKDPSNNVAGYTRSATAGSDAGREVTAAMTADSEVREEMKYVRKREFFSVAH